MPAATKHAAKLAGTLGPDPCVLDPRFLPWSLYHFVGSAGGYTRPRSPRNLTTAKYPGYFREWARLEQWRQRKRAGLPRPAAGIWKGGVLPPWAKTVSLEMDHHHAPQPPPPRPPAPSPQPAPNALLVGRAQKVMFTAWRPNAARDKRPAVSADLNVSGNPSQHIADCHAAVNAAKGRGQEPALWGNQSQVGIDHMWQFASDLGVPYIIWQAETIGEMVDVGVNQDGSIRPGSPFAVGEVVWIGNANAWTAAQRETSTRLIHDGRGAFIQETYTDCGDPWPDQYGTQGVPAAAISPGVGWGPSPFQLPGYQPHTPAGQWAVMSPYLAEGFDDTSWAVMPW